MENNFENEVIVEETAAPAEEKRKDFISSLIDKIKVNPKPFIIAGAAIVLALITIFTSCIVGAALANTYKTPVKIMQKYANKKTYFDNYDRQIALANGFCKSELKALAKLERSTEDYKEGKADDKEDFKDNIDELKEEYGNNYKFTYKIIDKEKLEKEDLRDIRDEFRDQADDLKDELEEFEDFDSDDWEEFADDLGFDGNKTKAKKYVSIMKKIRKKYANAKVTAGYTLTVEYSVKGSNLDEPEVLSEEMEITVIKVNGRWIRK